MLDGVLPLTKMYLPMLHITWNFLPRMESINEHKASLLCHAVVIGYICAYSVICRGSVTCRTCSTGSNPTKISQF